MIGYIWARQSNKYDKAVYSLESQVDACREAARKDGVTVTPEREYVVKFSGVDLWAIPELAELRRAIERTPGSKRVYCYAQDRMARGEEGPEIFWIVYELRRHGADLKIILDPIDLGDFAGQVNTLFKGHKAAQEPRDIRERTMRGRLKRVKDGKVWNHGNEKFGYRRIKEEGRAEFEPEEKAILEDIISRIFAGQSVRSIAKHLNDQKIATPDRRRGRLVKGKPTKGVWHHSTVRVILRDPALKGEGTAMRYQNGHSRGSAPKDGWIAIPDAYPALLSPERWDELQLKLSEIASKTANARNSNIPLVFRGRVICERCGRPMNVISTPYSLSNGEKRQTRAFACKHLDKAGDQRCRPWRQITVRYVEEEGWAAIVGAFQPEVFEAAALRVGTAPQESPYLSRRKALEESQSKKRTQQQNLITRLADASDVAASAILKAIDDLGREIQSLGDQIRRVDRELQIERQQSERTQDAMRDLTELARRLDEMEFSEKRKFVEAVGIVLLWNPENRTLTLQSPILSGLTGT